MNFKNYISKQAGIIESALSLYLPKNNSLISRAMKYSVLAGGKRLRPMLVIAGAQICGGNTASVLPAACAVEFLHTYSLVHDDLPAMDNDSLRRGKPTSHKKFGEAAAILTGDALLTEAFRLVCQCAGIRNNHPERILRAVEILSEAAGYMGMIEGQMKDTVEAGKWRDKNAASSRHNLIYIHENKTAALISASICIGAELSGAEKQESAALKRYGHRIGLTFQIMDDILDLTGDKKLLGKTGSDKDNNKLTFPAIYGLEKSREIAEDNTALAKSELSMFGAKAKNLIRLADYIIERKN